MTSTMGTIRAVLTLAAAAAAGALVWLSTQFDLETNAGFWAAMAVLAGGGALLGLVQIGRGDGNPAAMTLLALVPVALAAGWVLVAVQPDATELGNRVAGWSADIGIDGLVESLGALASVLAFGAGVVLGLTLAEAFSRQEVLETTETPVQRADDDLAARRRAEAAEADAVEAERQAALARQTADEERRAVRS